MPILDIRWVVFYATGMTMLPPLTNWFVIIGCGTRTTFLFFACNTFILKCWVIILNVVDFCGRLWKICQQYRLSISLQNRITSLVSNLSSQFISGLFIEWIFTEVDIWCDIFDINDYTKLQFKNKYQIQTSIFDLVITILREQLTPSGHYCIVRKF